MYYDWPEAAEAYRSSSEYMFGDQVIATPVVQPLDDATALATETVWLPEGEWIEEPTGVRLHGPYDGERSFSLDQVPLYLRPGTIIPMQPPMLNTGAKPVDPLILHILPLNDGQHSDYTLYEDSSQGRECMTGEFATTGLHARRDGDVLTVTVDSVKGSYPGMLTGRALQLELPGDWPPTHVEANGEELHYTSQSGNKGWSFTGNTLTTTV